jgi:hypothetical protein
MPTVPVVALTVHNEARFDVYICRRCRRFKRLPIGTDPTGVECGYKPMEPAARLRCPNDQVFEQYVPCDGSLRQPTKTEVVEESQRWANQEFPEDDEE